MKAIQIGKVRKFFEYLLLVVLIFAIFGFGYSYKQYKKIEQAHLTSLSILAKTTSQLVIELKDVQQNFPAQSNIEEKLKNAIRFQSLSLLDGYIDIASLDEFSLNGLLLIASNVDTLFPVSSEKTIQAVTDNYLNLNMKRLQIALNVESKRRSLP
jgi:hypothetical protein